MSNKQLDDSWDQFRYYLAVARMGTLSAAAAQLGTEHSTVARHIRTLEDRLKVTLFYRSNAGYALTEAGQRMLSVAEAIESAIVSARSTALSGEVCAGTVRVGAPDGFGTIFLAPRLGDLVRKYPMLDIELLATPRLFNLTKREADIVISLAAPEHARIVSRRLIEYKLYVYGSENYLDTHKQITTLQDIREHTIIGYVEELVFLPILNYLSVIGSGVEARIRSSGLVAQAYAALGGGGLCILPAFIGSSYPGLIPVLPDQISLTRTFHMQIHEDHRKAAHIRAVANFIADEVRQNLALFEEPKFASVGEI